MPVTVNKYRIPKLPRNKYGRTSDYYSSTLKSSINSVVGKIDENTPDKQTTYTLQVIPEVISVTDGVCNPETIQAAAYVQVGNNTPVVSQDCEIRYTIDGGTEETVYESAIIADPDTQYMNFYLYRGEDAISTKSVTFVHTSTGGEAPKIYTLDINNENASVNVDSEGHILPTAYLYLSCDANLLKNGVEVSGATYSISYSSGQHVQGVSIDSSTGVFTFASNFSFEGNSLEITVTGMVDGVGRGEKIMTITKSFPGEDGSPAVTYFLKLSDDKCRVVVNATSPYAEPSTITAQAFKVEGDNLPVDVSNASNVSIKYGFNVSSTSTVYSGPVSIDISKKWLRFELYVDNKWRDGEDIPIQPDGKDGTSGVSPFRLDLTNENASVNVDSEGHIIGDLPTCKASLWQGSTEIYGAVYALVGSYTGVTINSSTGVLTFSSSFNFTGDNLEITITATLGSSVVGTDIMTVSKNYPGADGSPAVRYYLKMSSDAVKVDKDGGVNPSTITAEGWKQVGDENPVQLTTGYTIKYGYNTVSPSSIYSGAITVDKTKQYITFELYVSNVWRDEETVPIISDGTNGTSGESVFRLDLTNDNASINADSNGNILPAAVRPTCQANLYYGSQDAEGATYSMTYPSSQSVRGVSINSTSGVITFNSGSHSTPFSFSGTSLELTITAKVNNVVCGTTIMTISKSIAGVDGTGEDAVSRWLVISANEVRVNPNNNTVNPTTITATAYKQVGGETPTVCTDATIKYSYNSTTASTTYSGAITVDKTKNYITFQLYYNNIAVNTQTVLILSDGKDGKDGEDGQQGRTGASVRGPVDWWKQTSSRRFSKGEVTDPYHQEDGQWIDIIYKDGHYYVCNTNYTGSCNDSWSSVSSYWTMADEEFEFIATNLLLANNAVINFLTGNEFYLRDGNGNITAGGAGGNGISFWAGSSVPSDAPFQVNYDGAIKATSGIFSGYVQYPYTFISSLSHTSTYYIADQHANLIADNNSGYYGMGNGGCLLLPEPCAELNGFTYNITAIPNIGTKAMGENNSISLITMDSKSLLDSPFKVYTHIGTATDSFAKLQFYGGHISITCMPYQYNDGVGYYWGLTQATGGVDCYGAETFEWTSSGGGGYWHFNSGDTITCSISNPPLNYSYWGSRGFKTPSSSTTVKVTVTGNTRSSSNVLYVCLDNQSTSSAVISFSGSTTRTYTKTFTGAANHSFNMYYSKTSSTSTDSITITFEVTSSSATLGYAKSIVPVYGYSEIDMDNAIVRIVAEDDAETIPSKRQNTLYVSRN